MANYPVSVILDGVGLNVTVFRYQDRVDFGLVADRELMPDLPTLVRSLEHGLGELTEAAGWRLECTGGSRHGSRSWRLRRSRRGRHRITPEQVRLADELGLDLVGIQDHPYQRRFLDTWTLLAYLAVRTSRIRLVPDVANLPLRLPAPFAKAAASLDLLSDGRPELGVGAGAFWDGIVAMGGPRRAPKESVDALEEAIAVMRAFWRGDDPVRFEGEHYPIRGPHPGPLPTHPIGIWLGAYGPRMLRVNPVTRE